MYAFLTSCNREHYLNRTLKSLEPIKDQIDSLIIHEDCGMSSDKIESTLPIDFRVTSGGQIKSIDTFFKSFYREYYLHLEDDWVFNPEKVKTFIEDSMAIMRQDPKIIKVLAKGEHKMNTYFENGIEYIDMTEHYGKFWYGFSWNPGVTNAEKLKELNLYSTEHDINLQCKASGFRFAYLPYRLYAHIGENSTR